MKPYSLAKLLHAFFHEWMGQQRNLSRHTVLSYRDTWKLLLRFVSERKRREITALSLSDMEAAEVLAFLQYLENDRKVSIGTRNCRLAAIHSFFTFVAHREPLAIAQCGEIARIPVKKMNRPAMCYLDAEEITAILRQPDRSNPEGQRDHALLGFLYNTGARIQEALNVCPQAIRFDSPAHVELFGKGRKSRVCPLWPETADRSALQVFDSNSSNMFKQRPKRRHRSRKNASAHIRFDTALESSWLPRASMRPSSEIGSDTLDWTLLTCTHELISKQNEKHSIRSMRRRNPLNHHGGSTIQSY